ncbi:MAG: hypothetical protein COW73_06640 [Nitrospirae bacterium CG18_big_fil_WC_8_21_14_2_50_70_55]|nr:ribbon-helix-helix protein, CopG family [Deltaproteobacteria bacterium]OIP66822.1 MAG: hypothetical protein AUK30_01540 [Nitrospirae bacterium CG2_30_70_394]PIQ05014.1 MAG: hypothetical protein COW73_06640 [Nitrospirae bacterium CG18_big_fil_WC_8_21_14_2_50_70_55]PIU77378.1 MAG: hypothetical protein COS73_10905 [Nitrospirae bacterium CG06_land_8_20_14_3_00_70_43]PIW82417.1 MAG: hypothetical protein COZ96_08820 [Nitrospirae bacterium CG_4_8_14_3_um_filter_70_85]PIX84465.1 MAG: hypothetical p
MRSVVSVSLPKAMASELERFVTGTGRNKSDVMKEALGLFLWEQRFQATRKVLTEKAKRLGLVTDDDLFETAS